MDPKNLYDLLCANPFSGVSASLIARHRGHVCEDNDVVVLTCQIDSGTIPISYADRKWTWNGASFTACFTPDAGPTQVHQEIERVLDVYEVMYGRRTSSHLADLAQVADALGAPANTQLRGLVSRIKTTRVDLEQYVRKMQQADADADEIKAVFGKAPMSSHAELLDAARRARRAEVESAGAVDLDLLEQVDQLLGKNKVPTHYDNGEPLSRVERIAYLDRRTSFTT